MAGAGTHLHRLIKRRLGQDLSATCRCAQWIRKMDRAGPTWCRKHLGHITGQLRREAKTRQWYWKIAARLPGAQFPIQALVLEAIDRAEKEARSHG